MLKNHVDTRGRGRGRFSVGEWVAPLATPEDNWPESTPMKHTLGIPCAIHCVQAYTLSLTLVRKC
jgi:hypothetical protein